MLSSGGGPGGQAWVSPDAVPKGENLRKFSRNLTKEAMEGKLDPVIGRDDVIRRVVQVCEGVGSVCGRICLMFMFVCLRGHMPKTHNPHKSNSP